MKKLAIILSLVLGITFNAAAQEDDESGQWFGSSREISSNAFQTFNFGEITSDIVTHEFVIRNTKAQPITITDISIPAGVSVTISKKEIEPNSEAKLIVTISRQLFDKDGLFVEPIVVTTKSESLNGVTTIKKTLYVIKGKLL